MIYLFFMMKFVHTCFYFHFENAVNKVIDKTNLVNKTFKNHLEDKVVPLQAWCGPEGTRKLRFTDFMTTAQDGGKVVSLMHWPLFTPKEIPLVLISVRG